MTYYPTLAEDLTRAKDILDRGRTEPPGLSTVDHLHFGGVIYGGDTFVAYKLLESFVAIIEQPKALELAAFMSFIRGTDIPNTIEQGRLVLVERCLKAEAEVERLTGVVTEVATVGDARITEMKADIANCERNMLAQTEAFDQVNNTLVGELAWEQSKNLLAEDLIKQNVALIEKMRTALQQVEQWAGEQGFVKVQSVATAALKAGE